MREAESKNKLLQYFICTLTKFIKIKREMDGCFVFLLDL